MDYGTVLRVRNVGLFHHVLVYMGHLHFVNGTISKIDDVLLEHDG